MKQQEAGAQVDPGALKTWLVNYISKRCDIPDTELHPGIPFEEFGIDSVQAVEITAELEQEFRIPVDPTALFEFNTIELLVAHVSSCSSPAAVQ
ncbi:MAG: acyl carrier protein [Roseateles sp.]|uniref:acyl carrier protein n=1 Tax=Roseateles sp. TaxID=1971397 RepID=UPI0040362B9D